MKTRFQIVALGEILWDLFPDRSCFGGAPANFACAASQLGGDSVSVQMLSGVGNDDLGTKALEQLKSHDVSTDLIQILEKRTGTVKVGLDSSGSAQYQFAEDVAWDHLAWSDEMLQRAEHADAICFGSLGQRTAESAWTIQKFVENTRPTCLRVFDINLRFPHVREAEIIRSLELCNLLKLNEDELPYVAEMLGLSGEADDCILELIRQFDIQLVTITLGSHGSVLYSKSRRWGVKAEPVEVVDTVGAGDAFTAALTIGLLNKWRTAEGKSGNDSPSLETLDSENLAPVLDHANQVAAFVCTQPGATPQFPAKLQVIRD